MVIPIANDEEILDLYICCKLDDLFKYDFAIPRSAMSYTSYLLNNIDSWTLKTLNLWSYFSPINSTIQYGLPNLLLILKRCMLYYKYQWMKTAKDYRRLVSHIDSLTENDNILCQLIVRYNEKLHGPRSSDQGDCLVSAFDAQQKVIIKRAEFLQKNHDQQMSLIYQFALSLAIGGDILIGLEYICTQGPLWLANFTIDHWLDIQNERFKNMVLSPIPIIKFELNNYRLFSQLPEVVLQKILCNITDIDDFHSMKLVCKQWYTILHQDSFWKDLYFYCYGNTLMSGDKVNFWKTLFFIRMKLESDAPEPHLIQLVPATLRLREVQPTDVVQLWETLTQITNPSNRTSCRD